jgi:hypothetical protein
MLANLVEGVEATLRDNLVGVYLRGSLALGDFNPETSDIDFLAVTRQPLSAAEFDALAQMHARLAEMPNPFSDRLEGSYIDQTALKQFLPHERRHPTIGPDWPFCWGDHRDNWILERWIVREKGILVSRPTPMTPVCPKALISPISPEALKQAVRAELAARLRDWAGGAASPDWLLPRYYQAFEIETMCRALYTLQHGALPSKPCAVAWALGVLPEPWRDLVSRSQQWRLDKTHDSRTITEVKGFVRWAAGRSENA